MSDDKPIGSPEGALLSEALRSVRKHRGMSPRAVAAGMNMAPRTYQRFEAGETRFNLDHIRRFARATRSDPYAIMMSVWIGIPDHAWHGCDNQIGTIYMIGLRQFQETLGERIREIDSRTLIAAVLSTFEALQATLESADTTKAWLEQGAEALAATRPKPDR